jgi:hypothetical protein
MFGKGFISEKEKLSFLSKMGVVFLIFTLGITSYLRVLYSSPFARSWDQVDFSFALERFDLLAMQPHFPGYPYFVFGGMVFNRWIENPAQALSVFNTLMLLFTALPIYWLANRYLSKMASLLACTAVQSLSYLWIMATEPMSEAAAVSVLWWFLWSLQRAKEDQARGINVLPMFLFSVLMGIRLSYVAFGLGIILLLYSKRTLFPDKKGYLVYIVKHLIIAVLFQFIWIGGLAATEGDIGNFLSLAYQFTFGHFNDWGGAITAESTPFIERFLQLLFINIFWVGLCGESFFTAVLWGLLLILIGSDIMKNKMYSSASIGLIFSYFAWALFAQNIDKPRHALPLIFLLAFFIILTALRSEKARGYKILIISCLFIIQSVHGYGLVKEKANAEPATYQLTNFLKEYEEPFVVYTWEEARIMDYLEADFPYDRLLTYEYFAGNIKQRGNKKIFITNRVLEGFENQGIQVERHVQKVKTFQSNPLFDPVYSSITLFEWKSE